VPRTHCRKICEGPHCTWFDNFSKTYSAYMPSSAAGAYHGCLWAGFGVRKYHFGGNLNFRRFTHRGITTFMPAMPPLMLDETMKKDIREVFAIIDAMGSHLLENSLVHKFDVRRLPPDIVLSPWLDRHHPAVAQRIREGQNFRDFHTSHLEDENPGSNEGLAKVARKMFIENKFDKPPTVNHKYKMVTCDVNIYHRMIKVV
jgi:hypothetical protein